MKKTLNERPLNWRHLSHTGNYNVNVTTGGGSFKLDSSKLDSTDTLN